MHIMISKSDYDNRGGIYKRKKESKKTRKHPFDQESDQEKKKVNTLSTKNLIKKKKKKR